MTALDYENVSGLPANPTVEQEAFASIAQSLKRMADILAAREAKAELDPRDARIAELERERDEANARYERTAEGSVELQRHRDAWRSYAYGTRDKPNDFLDGNMVGNGSREATAIEKAEARVAELEREKDRWKFCCEQNALSANNLSAEKSKAEAALAELRGRMEKARPLIEGAKRQAEIAWIDSRDLIEVLALLTDPEAKEGGGPDNDGRSDASPSVDRGDIAQPARDTDPVPATDARGAAIRGMVDALADAWDLIRDDDDEQWRNVSATIEIALAAARAAGITGKGTSDE